MPNCRRTRKNQQIVRGPLPPRYLRIQRRKFQHRCHFPQSHLDLPVSLSKTLIDHGDESESRLNRSDPQIPSGLQSLIQLLKNGIASALTNKTREVMPDQFRFFHRALCTQSNKVFTIERSENSTKTQSTA